MKKTLPLLLLAVLVSCKKDKENISDQLMVDSATLKIDSSEIPTIKNPDQSAAFELAPQNISAEKGRAIFSQNGKVLFGWDYFFIFNHSGQMLLYPIRTISQTLDSFNIKIKLFMYFKRYN